MVFRLSKDVGRCASFGMQSWAYPIPSEALLHLTRLNPCFNFKKPEPFL